MSCIRRAALLASFHLALVTQGAASGAAAAAGASGFRVLPYLQLPAADAVTVVWLSEADEAGTLRMSESDGSGPGAQLSSTPERAAALAYPEWEADRFFGGQPPPAPYVHRVRLTGLRPRTAYRYTVRQGSAESSAAFTTAPPVGSGPVRFVFFADSETEPESTGIPVDWPEPAIASLDPEQETAIALATRWMRECSWFLRTLLWDRMYLLDQTDGFANNLAVILQRRPDLIAIAGDLVESGGEQRDWDELWRHLTDVAGANLAGRIPVLAAPGNHEYYEGPQMGKYHQPGSERAVDRFRAYFAVPDNEDPDPRAQGRYYRLDYGPVTLIALDVTNGTPHQSADDTNYFLRGDGDLGGGVSPGFGPGTRQCAWLEEQLAHARQRSAFTFVFFHHVPYSVGPHGWPAGEGENEDTQSGVPVRELTPLFLRFGVDAAIAGHDEIWERSEVAGEEVTADGARRPHTLQVFDVGVAGDGLRGPQEGLRNPHQRFLVHDDAPEVWEEGVLVSGGKHYGHLEVDVLETREGSWHAVLKPVHVFPVFDREGHYLGYQRRLYDDVVTLTSDRRPTAVAGGPARMPVGFGFENPYPNPFDATVLLRFRLEEGIPVVLEVFDATGQRVRRLVDERLSVGDHAVEWDATDDDGGDVASGVYLFALRAGALRDTVEAALAR